MHISNSKTNVHRNRMNATRLHGFFTIVFAITAPMIVSLFAVADANAQGPRSFGGFQRARMAEPVTPVTRGYVFIDGVYVAPPYELAIEGGRFRINDVEIVRDKMDLTAFQTESVEEVRNHRVSLVGNGWKGGRRPPRLRGQGPVSQLREAAHATLALNGVAVFEQEQKPLLLDNATESAALLSALLQIEEPGKGDQVGAAWDESIVESESETWSNLLLSFEPSPEFVRRAESDVDLVVVAIQSSEEIVKASLWVDSIAYPLTLFAMIVVVVGFGHLLSHRPYIDGDMDANAEHARKVVSRSLLIFGLLSVVDLVWTLAATATGSMREMNPLGQGMIEDPLQLTLFKAVAVSTTIGLLYMLHRRPIAQVASWWSCLVLTLLTARWLTFNSMFM